MGGGRSTAGRGLTCERQADGHPGLETVRRKPDERQGQRRLDGQRCAGGQGQPAVRCDPQHAFLPRARRVVGSRIRWSVIAVVAVIARAGHVVLEPNRYQQHGTQ